MKLSSDSKMGSPELRSVMDRILEGGIEAGKLRLNGDILSYIFCLCLDTCEEVGH